MDLKTGSLLWPALSPPPVPSPRLQEDIQCETVVIGAGVTGAMAAYLLGEAGVEVVVLDRRDIARGSTPASTALLQYEIDTPLLELIGYVGVEHAQRAYQASRRSLDDLANLIKRANVACDLQSSGCLQLACEATEIGFLQKESAARREIGIEVELLPRQQLQERFDIDRPAALHSQVALQIDPFKLTHGLLHAAVTKFGVRVFSQAEIAANQMSEERNLLSTTDGIKVRCRDVVVATGYETPELFAAVRKFCTLKSTYALASEPLEKSAWPGEVMYWETSKPYLYARQTPDRRVIVGGEDEPIVDPQRRDALIEQKMHTLLQKFARLRSNVRIQPQFVWAGTFAETKDGLPYIGSTDSFRHCHFALGYGGNGITFSMLAGQIIRDAIIGKQNPDARLFRFDR